MDDSKRWRWFGEHDPYYGVLSGAQFRRQSLTAESLQSFFDSGESHIDHVLQSVGPIPLDSCLDFGCGVGRLLLPLSRRFRRVCGVDISPGMLEEAHKNCPTAELYLDLDLAPHTFDLVHSFIVIQHIPPRHGLKILDRLLERTAHAAFLHFSLGYNSRRDMIAPLRRASFVNGTVNLVRGRPHEPCMPRYCYSLNDITAHLHRAGIRKYTVESDDCGGVYTVSIVVRH